jgi:hypothetical protein
MQALGSLSRPFNNEGIRYVKAGRTPSLRGAQRRVNPEDSSVTGASRRKYY